MQPAAAPVVQGRVAPKDDTRLVYSTGTPLEKPKPARPAAVRPASQARDSMPGRIRIRLDRRASNRVVTVVTGLPGSPDDRAALARSLKTACGAGGTLKDGVLELQGDHRDKVEAALAARHLSSKRSGG
jgi:translation initiation factor 1